MTIYGISQFSGVERLLGVERGDVGVVLTIHDRVGSEGRGRIVVPGDHLLSTLMDRPAGGSTLEGASQACGVQQLLDLEVRRNEVLLRARAGSEDGWDVAVGLDDFQDALEKVIGEE